AISNDGDADTGEETVYATEFFSQGTSVNGADDTVFDVGRVGLVYAFNVGTGAVAGPISIAPIANTGFLDSNGSATGCFPNQLDAATINNGRLYVTGVCTSPRGPVGPVLDANGALSNSANFKTQVHGAVWTIDLSTNSEVPSKAVLLTQAFQS